jgi:hypothetical protein
MGPEQIAAKLLDLAVWVSDELDDEDADRQYTLEQVETSLRSLAAEVIKP